MTRELDEQEKEVVIEESTRFIEKYIGRNMIEEWESLPPLVEKWKNELYDVLAKITSEYFEWFEGE